MQASDAQIVQAAGHGQHGARTHLPRRRNVSPTTRGRLMPLWTCSLEKGAHFVNPHSHLDATTAQGRLLFNLSASPAEFEHRPAHPLSSSDRVGAVACGVACFAVAAERRTGGDALGRVAGLRGLWAFGGVAVSFFNAV